MNKKTTLAAFIIAFVSGSGLAASTEEPTVSDAEPFGIVSGWGGFSLTSLAYAKEGSFEALVGKGAAVTQIDVSRLAKANGDADRYAYWLVTNNSYGSLVEAFRNSAGLIEAGDWYTASDGTLIKPWGEKEQSRQVEPQYNGRPEQVAVECEKQYSEWRGAKLYLNAPKGVPENLCDQFEKKARGDFVARFSPWQMGRLVIAMPVLGSGKDVITGSVSTEFRERRARLGAAYFVLGQAAWEASAGSKEAIGSKRIMKWLLPKFMAAKARATQTDRPFELSDPGKVTGATFGYLNGLSLDEAIAIARTTLDDTAKAYLSELIVSVPGKFVEYGSPENRIHPKLRTPSLPAAQTFTQGPVKQVQSQELKVLKGQLELLLR